MSRKLEPLIVLENLTEKPIKFNSGNNEFITNVSLYNEPCDVKFQANSGSHAGITILIEEKFKQRVLDDIICGIKAAFKDPEQAVDVLYEFRHVVEKLLSKLAQTITEGTLFYEISHFGLSTGGASFAYFVGPNVILEDGRYPVKQWILHDSHKNVIDIDVENFRLYLMSRSFRMFFKHVFQHYNEHQLLSNILDQSTCPQYQEIRKSVETDDNHIEANAD